MTQLNTLSFRVSVHFCFLFQNKEVVFLNGNVSVVLCVYVQLYFREWPLANGFHFEILVDEFALWFYFIAVLIWFFSL